MNLEENKCALVLDRMPLLLQTLLPYPSISDVFECSILPTSSFSLLWITLTLITCYKSLQHVCPVSSMFCFHSVLHCDCVLTWTCSPLYLCICMGARCRLIHICFNKQIAWISAFHLCLGAPRTNSIHRVCMFISKKFSMQYVNLNFKSRQRCPSHYWN